MTIEGRNSVQKTSVDAYKCEGAGIGAGGDAVSWIDKHANAALTGGKRCIEIGCGGGGFVTRMLSHGFHVTGIDVAEASVEATLSAIARKGGIGSEQFSIHCLDVSHEPIPLSDNSVDLAVCTETIEHLANPYYMFAEIKRVLCHDGYFVLSFPMPEDNLGYDCGQHAHVYPGFLCKDSFERFCMQMYFKVAVNNANGSSAWYLLRNYKGEGIVDPFAMIAGNYTEDQLYGCLTDF